MRKGHADLPAGNVFEQRPQLGDIPALLAKDPRDRFPSAVTAIAELAKMKV